MAPIKVLRSKGKVAPSRKERGKGVLFLPLQWTKGLDGRGSLSLFLSHCDGTREATLFKWQPKCL